VSREWVRERVERVDDCRDDGRPCELDPDPDREPEPGSDDGAGRERGVTPEWAMVQGRLSRPQHSLGRRYVVR
jgi:hypothetical protein